MITAPGSCLHGVWSKSFKRDWWLHRSDQLIPCQLAMETFALVKVKQDLLCLLLYFDIYNINSCYILCIYASIYILHMVWTLGEFIHSEFKWSQYKSLVFEQNLSLLEFPSKFYRFDMYMNKCCIDFFRLFTFFIVKSCHCEKWKSKPAE